MGNKGQGRLVVGVVLALAVLGVLLLAIDASQAARVLSQADWKLVGYALVATVISYACLSYGFVAVCRIFQINTSLDRLLSIGFVSIVLNHLIAVGGLAGLSLRVVLLQRQGVQTQRIVSASLFHSYFNNLALCTLVPIGLAYILVTHSLSRAQDVGIAFAVVLLVAILVLATVVVFSSRMRASVLGWLGWMWQVVRRRDIRGSLHNVDQALSEGVAAIRRNPLLLALPVLLIVADWVSNVATLWLCFDALGNIVGPGILLTGFVVGVAVGLVSFVPGGIGVQEGSMAGIYALLGVSFEQAVLAAVLFRVVYYLVPFGLSLLLYRRVLRVAHQGQAP